MHLAPGVRSLAALQWLRGATKVFSSYGFHPGASALTGRRRFSSHASGGRLDSPLYPLDSRLKPGDEVVMAMSGGVDSSVSLRLLAQHDLSLSAVFMRNWSQEASDSLQGCEWEKDWEDVQRVCRMLDVPYRMIDLSREYWLRVFEPAISDWAGGVTPNPDISCNREIKFGALMDKAMTSPSAYLATGHYAQLQQTPAGRIQLHSSPDKIKDQSYFLSSVSESQLEKSLFPIGHLEKATVKVLAHQFGLPTASRKESMGICFIENKQRDSFSDFLSEYIPPQPGKIITEAGVIVGDHQGLWTMTEGERWRVGGLKNRWYVARRDQERNEIVVVEGADHPSLVVQSFTASGWNWVWPEHPPTDELNTAEGLKVEIKTMSSVPKMPAAIRRGARPGEYQVEFEGEARLPVTPGQAVVAWKGSWCLGSGVIQRRSPV